MKFSNLPLRGKLGIAFGILSAMVLCVAVLSVLSLGRADTTFENFVGGISARTKVANHLRNAVDARAVAARNLVLLTKKSELDLETERVKKAHTDVQETLAKLKQLVQGPGVSEAARAAVENIDKVEKVYGPVAVAILDLVAKGDTQAAIRDMNEKCRPLLSQLVKATDDYFELATNVASILSTASSEQYLQQRNILIGASVLSILVAIMAAHLVTRSITGPVGRALQLANAVAGGDLTQHIEANGKDEISMLLSALGRMNTSLLAIVSQVRGSSESIATGSAQIASGNLDLSQRTEKQAATLEETAATMEQLTATIKTNSDSAQQANQLAIGATDIAIKGGGVVSQAVSTMRMINESSKKISEIISVIDSIAFQTNILALNAAVEAARAGEQGRGFAVVATEVRSLAKRSADAAKEIKTLIQSSVEQVEQGTRQVDAAGATMAEIVDAFKSVGDLVAEISSASVEQSSGVSQVGEAVSQMDQVTQQNAALVEESAAAAASLKSQADNLVKAVATFRLSATT